LFLDFIKKRLEIYGLVVVAAGAIVVSVLGFQGKLALVQKDVETIKNEQLEQKALLEDKVDAELLGAKLTPIANLGEQLSTKLEILDANVDGLRVASIAGAEERAAQLEGRLVTVQRMVHENAITTRAAIDSLSIIAAEVEALKRLAAVPDTVTLVDTLQVEKDGDWWNPFD
jgi:hypothetical protein